MGTDEARSQEATKDEPPRDQTQNEQARSEDGKPAATESKESQSENAVPNKVESRIQEKIGQEKQSSNGPDALQDVKPEAAVDPPRATDEAPKAADGISKGPPEPPDAYMFRAKPAVRDCDWHEFKNRYPDEDNICAIETLLSSRDLEADMEFEQIDRKAEVKQRSHPKLPDSGIQQPQTEPEEISDTRYERVRINSAYILAYLAKVTGERTWSRRPHSFLAPFPIFIHHHPKMQEDFRNLRERYGNEDTQAAGRSNPSVSSLEPGEQENEGATVKGSIESDLDDNERSKRQDTTVDTERGSLKAYQDMACYMQFMENSGTGLMRLYKMFDDADYTKPLKVRYSDLWYLFRQGELLFSRKGSSSEGSSTSEATSKPSGHNSSDSYGSSTADIQLWRGYYLPRSAMDWTVDDLAEKTTGKLYRDKELVDSGRYFGVQIYYIDFDGEAFAPSCTERIIHWYDGEKDVSSLPVYPVRFSKDYKQTLQRLQARGEMFRSLVTQSHPSMSYLGWNLIRDPQNELIKDNQDRPITIPEHIDSDVVVDFREAYQTCPPWKPIFFTINDAVQKSTSSNDEFAIVRWTDRGRSQKTSKTYEIVVHTDGIEDLKCNELAESGGFLLPTRGKTMYLEMYPGARQNLLPEDLALLPSRLFVYSLRNRKFFNADIRLLKPIKREQSTFEKLKVSVSHKTMIESVVFEHFEKKKAQELGRTNNLELSDQDFIRGKGRGLVILLHGAPGVGKTATAEAVADVYQKPLFPITCGDLGIEPKEVERNLSEIFRLASVWDCILLLDEAEIFLSPREKRDDNLQRNALVSVFLRILEYYPGILFLTTNRPGALDEAVKSRVHITLAYPQLSKTDTVALFKMNIDRLKKIEKERAAITEETEMAIEEGGILDFAEQHYDDFSHASNADSRWNGRQIRNAFQIASSLARYEHFVNSKKSGEEAETSTSRGLYLGARHFKQVEKATVDYDEFRNKMFGATDSELALRKEERGPDPSRQPFPPQASRFEGSRRRGPSSMQRHVQSSPAVPLSRERGGGHFGSRGRGKGPASRGYDAGYSTPKQQRGEEYGQGYYDEYDDFDEGGDHSPQDDTAYHG